jgi:nucleoside-diphosphate-sugar epimerase
MKVLITGAAGFVGGALSEKLGSLGHDLVCVTRQGAKGTHAIGSMDSSTEWSALLDGVDCVVHCAARAHILKETSADPAAEYHRSNVLATRRLAEQAAGRGVGRFVFLSSIGVLGTHTNNRAPFSDSDTVNPQEHYAVSKLYAEKALTDLSVKSGMEVVFVRAPLVYGLGAKGNFAALVNLVRKGIPLPLGAVHNKRSLVALDNLVDFLALCADRLRSPKAANQAFLISDGRDVSTTELLQGIARAYGLRTPLVPVPEKYIRIAARLLGKTAAADRVLGSLQIDSSRAREVLGWHPVVSMDEQLNKMA